MKADRVEHYMGRVLNLASQGIGKTSPNPMVGAVIVKNNHIVGEGYHRKAGLPHGEIEALRSAGKQARGASLFVNLEPCCHFGRTPPCTDRIIEAGIKTVYVGMRDPNPLVSGKGIQILKANGIEVVSNILKKSCERLNEVFTKYIRTQMPFVILKSAVSLDGKIATRSGDSKWITGAQAREQAHAMRNQVDAILVGAGTVIKDNPRLTTRMKNRKGKNPVRIILDNEHRIPLSSRVFRNSLREKVIYACSRKPTAYRAKKLAGMKIGLCVIPGKNGTLNLNRFMRQLGQQGIGSLLIEGGGEINASALKARIVDKVVFFVAPLLIGGTSAPGAVGGKGILKLKDAYRLQRVKTLIIGEDFMVEGYCH